MALRYQVKLALDYTHRIVAVISIAAWGYTACLMWPILKTTRSATDTLLTCKGHGACLPSEILATTGAIRYTTGQVAKAMPVLTSAAKDAAANSVKASTQTVLVAQNLNGLVGEARKTVVESQETVRLLNVNLDDLHSLISSLRPDLDNLLKSADTATQEAGKSLVQMTGLLADLRKSIAEGSPEAMRIIKDAQAILENPNIQMVLGNFNNASANIAEITKTIDISTRALRQKINQVKYILEKLAGLVKLTISPF